MGVTTTLMIGFWLASSYIEYRIIKAIPALKPLFDHPLGGIVVSVAIGMAVGWVMGPAAGVGAALGQLLGLATNNFTYEMYNKGGQLCDTSKRHYGNVKTHINDNRDRLEAAKNTMVYGAKAIGATFYGAMWLIGLPFRIGAWCSRTYNSMAARKAPATF